MPIETINPTTGETLQSFEPLTSTQLEQKLEVAKASFDTWRNTSFATRSSVLLRTADLLDSDKQQLGALLTLEMGKTLASAIAEIEKCALACRYYAANAEAMLSPHPIKTAASQSFIQYVPLGPILAIMPWNFPFWQVFRFAAPALMAGNVGLLKHASNVPQCSLSIEQIFNRAGLPPGAFQSLLVSADQVATLIADPRISAVTVTGSEPAGRSVAATAGDAIKKCVLELGGSDAFIVMPSVDVEQTVTMAVKARTINNGQSCIAAKRFIVADEIYDEFEARFVKGMRSLAIGDPMLITTQLGPLATSKLREDLHRQVQEAVNSGATLLTGGKKLNGPGYFYESTVLAGVPRTSASFHEEFFGPVAMIFRARDAAHALEIANDSPFGLSASVWTRDTAERDYFLQNLETGMIFVNAITASTPELPFGGVKRSGYGRELSELGIREFVNIQSVWID